MNQNETIKLGTFIVHFSGGHLNAMQAVQLVLPDFVSVVCVCACTVAN